MLRITSLMPMGMALIASAALANDFATTSNQVTYGDHYIVKYRSTSTFKALHAELLSTTKTLSKDAFGNDIVDTMTLPGSNAAVNKALPNLQMMIVEGNEADAEALRNNPDVEYVEREMYFPAPRPLPTSDDAPGLVAKKKKKLSDSEITWGLKAVKAPEAWKLKTDTAPGTGVKVLILDTGIDKNHPEVKNRFADGRDLLTKKNNDIDAGPAPGENFLMWGLRTLTNNKKVKKDDPMPYPYFDQVGHGTHVAGTIAAEMDGNGVVGVAYNAKLYIGRVCGKLGCSTTALVDGLDWGQQVGADVVNMSLGGPLSSKAQADAMAHAADLGIVPVAAAGNDGTDSLGFPAGYPKVISVGAIDENMKKTSFSQWGPTLMISAPGNNILSSVPLGTGRASVVKIKTGTTYVEVPSSSFAGSSMPKTPLIEDLVFAKLGKPDDFKGLDVKGKTALLQRGEILFADKVKNAIAAGAVGVLIYNNEPGLISGAITEDGSEVGVPIAMVEKTVGEDLVSRLANGEKPSSSLDIIKTDYASFQGTSMACPHVVGVVALLRWANPKISTADITAILKATAQKPNDTDANIGQNQYGAGIIDAEAAVAKALAL